MLWSRESQEYKPRSQKEMTKNIFKQNKTDDKKLDKWTIYLISFLKNVYIFLAIFLKTLIK